MCSTALDERWNGVHHFHTVTAEKVRFFGCPGFDEAQSLTQRLVLIQFCENTLQTQFVFEVHRADIRSQEPEIVEHLYRHGSKILAEFGDVDELFVGAVYDRAYR